MPKRSDITLTAAFCRTAKPGVQIDPSGQATLVRASYPDREVRGLELRVAVSGDRTWSFRYRDRLSGKQSRVMIGVFDPTLDGPANEPGESRRLTLAGARAAGRLLLTQVDSGEDPANNLRKAKHAATNRIFKTMGELADAYFAACESGTHRTGRRRKKAASTLANERWMWGKYLQPRMARDDPYAVSRREIRAVLREIYAVATGQTDKCRALLSQMFNYLADEDDEVDRANPVARVKKMTEAKARTRRLSDGELKRVWAALRNPHGLRVVKDERDAPLQVSQAVRLAIELCMITLQRRSEVAGMKTDELDLGKKTWLIPEDRTKGRREHLVPLSERAVRVIQAALELHIDPSAANSVHVFPSPRFSRRPIGGESLTHAMADITAAVAIENATLHDLRRTGATGIAALGVQPYIVSKVLSHQEGDGGATVTNRHYNLYAYLPEKRDALDRWAEKLDTLFGDEAGLEDVGDHAGHRKEGGGLQFPPLSGSVGADKPQVTPLSAIGPISSWAGPVANSGEIERFLGVGRTTLHRWVKTGAIVGLLRGEKKLAYPLDQFVDNRPVEGLGDILALAPSPRSAWFWMRQPNTALDGRTPIACLHAGRRSDVTQAARNDMIPER